MQIDHCDISFSEKVRIYSHDYLKCCSYIALSGAPQDIFTKMLYSKLVYGSQMIEDFLDFHGAKNNRDWYFYRELSAAVRHISLGGYSQKHIANRLGLYELENAENFEKDGRETLDFVKATLIKISPVILDEAKRLGIPMPGENIDPADFPGVVTGEMLKYDIDDTDMDLQKKNIVKIASEFLNIALNFEQLRFYKPYDFTQILTIVPDKVNEVEISRFEMLIHNLQSSFDTYVSHGGYRFGDRKLRQIRGYFSVIFHLLKIIGRFLHFYERHLHEAGYKNTYKNIQDRLSNLVDPKKLLDRTINYGLYYVCLFSAAGKELAREIINENIERSKITVGIPVKLGFHSRPSLLVAKIVDHYGGQVELVVGTDRFDASSVLDLQWAGGKIQKENISRVTFEGDNRALKDIEILDKVNYGEDTMGKGIPLPKELNYLK
ncbi:MAG: HPr family phosphocarrier protein [Desulfobacterales bacterium]|nr:HPr family phosphocarrier protein [Desulfobacterales bacterium]